ncbi:MAG: winged helix-turn-helix domain-containing protein [Calditrichaeota bacterium]|nr:winged helix-turn-helix domain-containing protein [Calditrichota bacterium]
MSKINISRKSAKRLALNTQLSESRAAFSKGKKGVLQLFEKLGYVQIDTISVITRAHHHTIWTRCPDYSEEILTELQSVDRTVFEYWGHAMSYLPMSDYRFYVPQMKRFHDPYGKWEKERLAKYGHLMKPALDRIRAEGPLSSKDFEGIPVSARKMWENPKPYKAALEMLFWQGEIMVSERRNFQRVFDLTERVLPDNIDLTVPTEQELGEFSVKRALQAFGIAREKEILNHIYAAKKETIKKSLNELVESGEVIRIEVSGVDKPEYFALVRQFIKPPKPRKRSDSVYILSPFDNLVIHRERIQRLFGFEYTIECYVPAAKRVYGYFVLPILWGDDFVGRMDAKADRKKKTLIVRNLVFEEGFDKFDSFLPGFDDKLRAFSDFNGCEKIVFEKVTPAKLKSELW